MTQPRAVVFDCDGVLVDSEPHSVSAWLDVLAALGHPAGAAEVEACTGLGFEPTRAALSLVAPLPPSDELWARLLDSLARSFERGLTVFADAFGTLESARTARLPVAVVSASPRSRLDLTLATAGLSFAVTVSGDEVAAGKPAPDGYLEAARRLGVEPADCVVVEDSIPGVLAAVAAGARVVAVERSGREGLRAALADAGARVVGEVTAAKLGL